jgi:hypothetical protein
VLQTLPLLFVAALIYRGAESTMSGWMVAPWGPATVTLERMIFYACFG